MEREVEGAKVGELKRGVTAPGLNGMNMRPCQALPPLCEALPQLVADKHWESNQVSTRPSPASLTVRILRYEIEKGMRAFYKTIVFATFIAGVNYFHKLKDFFAMSPNT